MAKKKLVGIIAERAIELSATHTNVKISQVLKEEFGIDVSAEAIRQFLKGIRQDRAEQTKALVQEHIRATAPGDLKTLDLIIAQEKEWFESEGLKISEKLAIAKELRQTIDTKLKYSGAAEGENEFILRWAEEDSE